MKKNKKKKKLPHICICICTYKRTVMLNNLLEKIGQQKTGRLFSYSVNVVDNDKNGSAAKAVKNFQTITSIKVNYEIEPHQNISLARNKAVTSAKGDFLAFIDDDEFPDKKWLLTLYRTIKKYETTGVLGPVLPFYNSDAPSWLIKSGICNRPTLKTGKVLDYSETRTGNALLKAELFHDEESPFDPNKGKIGGEDMELFRKFMKQGHTFIWCEDAPVWEIIGPERYKKMYYIKRSMLIGGHYGTLIRKKYKVALSAAIASFLISVFSAILVPVFLIPGQHIFIPHTCRLMYHISRLSGIFGYMIVKKRDD